MKDLQVPHPSLNNGSLITAAEQLMRLGREKSAEALLYRILATGKSLRLLEASFNVAIRAGNFKLAWRILVYAETNLRLSEITEATYHPANWPSLDKIMAVKVTLQEHQKPLRDSLPIFENCRLIGSVCPFNPHEDLDLLFDACSKLVQKGENVNLLLIGDDQAMEMKKTGASSPAGSTQSSLTMNAPWLIRTGRVPHDKVPPYLELLEVVVIPHMPSAAHNSVSFMKAAEALAYGKRLVVPNVAPFCENAKNFDGIRTFEPGSATSLTDSIQESLSLPAPNPSTEFLLCMNAESPTRTSTKKVIDPISNLGLIGHAKSIDIANVDYLTAVKWYNQHGRITDTVRALERLKVCGELSEKNQLKFEERLRGLMRLKDGFHLPPREFDQGLKSHHKHILYCLHQSVPYVTNGYATRSHGIAVGLKKAGWQVHTATRPGFPWDSGVQGLARDDSKVEVEGITYAAAVGSSLFDIPQDQYIAEAAEHFVNEAKACGAEVIVAASNYITALPAMMAARRLGLPFVYEVRGLWEVTRSSTHEEWAGSEHYELMRELENKTACEADLVITLTEELADELANRGISRECIKVVPNAADPDVFQPMAPDEELVRELNLKPGVPVIGYAGSAVAYEGLDLLLESLAKLKAEDYEFAFVLIGDGAIMDSLKEKAKALGISEECRFTGRVAFDKVPRYMSLLDIMPIPRLSCAVTEMVSALKPLEAMAMAKAVVLSDVSPHKTIAGMNDRARLFKKDSADDLFRVIKSLIDNSTECRLLGGAARSWIKKERSWSQVTRHYADALAGVTERESGTRKASGVRTVKTSAKELSEKSQLNKNPKAISILDEISEECWKYEFSSYPIRRHEYLKQVESSTADFCFIESCWKGNRGAWQYAFTSPGLQHRNAKALVELLSRVGEKMPILFWNKEDPMHYEKYLPIARFADIIFTTDSNKIEDYRRDIPDADVYAVPFAAQQKICNPSGRFLVEPESVCFAGSYYGVGHDERKRQMDALLPSIIDFGGVIYDRMSAIDSERYKFPKEYTPFIREAVPFTEVTNIYKKFKVFLNVNTIVDSPTMMSRRVYELLACGTPVVSTPSRAIEEQFPGIVHTASNAKEANAIIENLITNERYWERVSHIGYREVMKKHTYTHRYQNIRESLGYLGSSDDPLVSIITCTRRPNMIDRIVDNATRQNYSNCELILVLQDFTSDQAEYLVRRIKESRSNIKGIKVLVENDADMTLGERFNKASAFAKGEYIAKFDDDDFYFENYLGDMLIPFTFGDFGLVGKREIYFYLSESNKTIKRFSGKKHFESKFVAGATFVFKKEVFDKYRFNALNRGEDSDLLERFHKDGIKVYAADPYNFIVWRGDVNQHTWGARDEYFLAQKDAIVVGEGFREELVRF